MLTVAYIPSMHDLKEEFGTAKPGADARSREAFKDVALQLLTPREGICLVLKFFSITLTYIFDIVCHQVWVSINHTRWRTTSLLET